MAQFFKASPKNSIKSHILKNVLVEKLDHQGRGIAFFQNKPLFVEGALIGEELDVQVTESKKRYSKGKITKIKQASEYRVSPSCPHYEQCGGCHLQHTSADNQVTIKASGLMDLFARFAKKVPSQLAPAITSDEWGYRRSARLGVQYDRKTKKVAMGFRRALSNDLIEQQVCPVLKAPLAALIVPLKALLNSLKSKADLGHVEMIWADQGAIVLLRHLKALPASDVQLIKQFSEKHTLNFFSQPSKTQLDCLSGVSELTYQLPDWQCNLNFSATDFLQVNEGVNQKMVKQALNWLALTKQDKVLDLFCGLGNFTLPIAKQVASVVGVEGVQKMVDRATQNALSNEITNATFFQADLSAENLTKQPWANESFTKVLLDPARAGAFESIPFIISLKPSHIVYVSCDPVTLARDSQLLLDKGYKLDKLGLLDMFPQTGHMESMALFIK
ncbi:23S rRNA (uracil(1939)-C(5))-methyltransferase RlmD [Psychromonas sp. Urea-02u-13]|uniref:23S rRNA (uracil(1939)-C(5))-methyltransferase RlmD n=1 Tax=Psychromonas sp. Urea-02u-13 TaxID=2058326 RepID=UPI000C329D3C|nr:23S rRNA (uracil(1939)-C(5))-methyltransferase RlmD [Psychromonas sp. Urea-02u-13]PKG40756.1 23S rRNA (uracil(1939)-C(5))-methyltransferase RlmD [Psychromonas sp. Urea-02u-13]